MKKHFFAVLLSFVIMVNLVTVGLADGTDTKVEDEIVEAYTSNPTSTRYLNLGGKVYTCTTTFAYTKVTNTYYKAGLYTNCAANTKRELSLQIKFDTSANGYVTKSGTMAFYHTGSTTEYVTSISEALDSLIYVYYTGSCKYSNTVSGVTTSTTGIVNYSYY